MCEDEKNILMLLGVKEVQTADTTTYEYFPVHGGNLVMDIQAASNAHIALTSGPADEAPIYEIFLGGWDNTKSAIRLHKEKPDKAEAATEQIVTDAEFRRFIIKWNYAAITVRHSTVTMISIIPARTTPCGNLNNFSHICLTY